MAQRLDNFLTRRENRVLGRLSSDPDTIYCVDVKYPNQCF